MRVSINEIAKQAGVSNATVSMALRDHPKISKGRREAIQKLAQELGYRADPNLAMIASNRWKPSKSATGIAVAYICWPRRSHYEIDRFKGAKRRLDALGYTIEPIKLNATESPQKIAKVLRTRGVRGIIWDLPQSCTAFELMPWEHFTAVGMGTSSEVMRLHSVQQDLFLTCENACEKVAAKGYKRPGLILYSNANDQRVALCEGAYRVACRKFGWTQSENPLSTELDTPTSTLAKWISQTKPDIVISMVSVHLLGMRQLGIKVPKDMGFVSLHIWPDDPTQTGYNPLLQQQGEIAGSLLHTSMLSGEWGLPESVRVVGLEGKWQEGKTV